MEAVAAVSSAGTHQLKSPPQFHPSDGRVIASDKTIRNETGSLRSILKRDRILAYLKDDGVTLPKVSAEDVGVALSHQ